MNTQIELMNLFWTTAGMFPCEGHISRYSFKDRVESAAKAGFKGIGLWHTDLEHTKTNIGLKEMKRIMDANGMKYLELEFLTDWFLDGGRKFESDMTKKQLFEASAALGAKHIKIGDFYASRCSMQHAVDSFGQLCREAEQVGATIAIEFMKTALIGDLDSALVLVTKTAAKNGGMIVDIVHQVNIGIPLEAVSKIPVEYLVGVELNDGLLPGPRDHDPGARRFCGEGEFDIRAFIDSILATGYKGPWAVEVFNRAYTELSLDELNRRSYQTTIKQF